MISWRVLTLAYAMWKRAIISIGFLTAYQIPCSKKPMTIAWGENIDVFAKFNVVDVIVDSIFR